MVAGLSVMGVVIVVVAILATVFGVKYFKSRQGHTEHASDELYYENQPCTTGETRRNVQYENYPPDGHIHNTGNFGMLPTHSDAMKPSNDSIPYENPDDLQLKRPTDSSPYENPDAITSEYLTIPESGTETPSSIAGDVASSALSSLYEDIKDVNMPYDTVDMDDISATVNPYEKIRH